MTTRTRLRRLWSRPFWRGRRARTSAAVIVFGGDDVEYECRKPLEARVSSHLQREISATVAARRCRRSGRWRCCTRSRAREHD